MFPCWNHIYGCTNQVQAQYDLCPTCFEEEDDRTVIESWEQDGAPGFICPHGHDIRDCARCNPVEA